MVRIITWNLALSLHLQKLNKVKSAEYRACMDHGETLEHDLCKGSVFSRLRADLFLIQIFQLKRYWVARVKKL